MNKSKQHKINFRSLVEVSIDASVPSSDDISIEASSFPTLLQENQNQRQVSLPTLEPQSQFLLTLAARTLNISTMLDADSTIPVSLSFVLCVVSITKP